MRRGESNCVAEKPRWRLSDHFTSFSSNAIGFDTISPLTLIVTSVLSVGFSHTDCVSDSSVNLL